MLGYILIIHNIVQTDKLSSDYLLEYMFDPGLVGWDELKYVRQHADKHGHVIPG